MELRMSLSHYIYLAKIVESAGIFQREFNKYILSFLYPEINSQNKKKGQNTLYQIFLVLKKQGFIEIDDVEFISPTKKGKEYYFHINALLKQPLLDKKKKASQKTNPNQTYIPHENSIQKSESFSGVLKNREKKNETEEIEPIKKFSKDLISKCKEIEFPYDGDKISDAVQEMWVFWKSLHVDPLENPPLPLESITKLTKKIAVDNNLVEPKQITALEEILKEYWELCLDSN